MLQKGAMEYRSARSGFLQPLFSGGEGNRWLETSHWFIHPQWLCHTDQVPDGDCNISFEVDLEGRLDVLHRPQRHLLPNPHPSGLLPLSQIYSRRSGVPVSSLALNGGSRFVLVVPTKEDAISSHPFFVEYKPDPFILTAQFRWPSPSCRCFYVLVSSYLWAKNIMTAMAPVHFLVAESQDAFSLNVFFKFCLRKWLIYGSCQVYQVQSLLECLRVYTFPYIQ